MYMSERPCNEIT